MKRFFDYIRANWAWLLCTIVVIALAIIAIIVICKKEAKNVELQREYNSLVRDYNDLARRDSILFEDYIALQRIDSVCCSANDSLSKALGDLRRRCDSLQAHPRVQRVVVNPPKNRTTKPRRTRTGGYPALDW